MPPFRSALPLTTRKAPEERPTTKAVPLFNRKCLRTRARPHWDTEPHDFRCFPAKLRRSSQLFGFEAVGAGGEGTDGSDASVLGGSGTAISARFIP